MADDHEWVSTATRQPQNRQRVYARVQYGQPKTVTFYTSPTPRWEGADIIYDFLYFAEWAVLDHVRKQPGRAR